MPLRPTPIANLLLVTLYSTLLLPIIAILYGYNPETLAACAGGFLILLVADVFLWFYRWRASQFNQRASQAGMLIGLLWTAEISVNNFIAPPLPARDIIDNIFWAIIALTIFIHACINAYRARRMWAGVIAGAWTGFASGAIACGTALSLIVFGMRLILQDPLNITEWAARGAGSSAPGMAAYFAFETLAGGLMHLLILGLIMGLLLGILGGASGKTASLVKSWIRRGTD